MQAGLADAAPTSSGKTQLTTAAIILIVCAAVGWLISVVDVAFRIYNLAQGIAPPHDDRPGFAFGFYGAMYGMLAIGVLTILLAPVLIFGAVQMLRTRMYRFCRICSILAMLPITTYCCCVVTLPIGIWLLVILNRPDVRAVFERSASM